MQYTEQPNSVICPNLNTDGKYEIVYMVLPGKMINTSTKSEIFAPIDKISVASKAWYIINGIALDLTRKRHDLPNVNFNIPCGLYCKQCKNFYAIETSECNCGTEFSVYKDFGKRIRTNTNRHAIDVYLPMSGMDIMSDTGSGSPDTSSCVLFYKTITGLSHKGAKLNYNNIFIGKASLLTGGMMCYE